MNFNIQLNLDEVNVVLAALGKLPLETSMGAFEKIRVQAQQQAQAQQASQPDEAPAEE